MTTRTKEAPVFGRQLRGFLRELDRNNDREWFRTQKERYEAHVREPARAFARAAAGRLARFAPYVVADDRKVGGSVLRMHRDVRFGGDKRPFHVHLALRFPHEAARETDAPGYFLRIGLAGVHVGAGLWRPGPEALALVRDRIVEEPDAWLRARDARGLRRAFDGLGGRSLQRPPRGAPSDHPLLDDLKRKDFVVVADWPVSAATAPELLDRAVTAWRSAGRLMDFLCGALGLPW